MIGQQTDNGDPEAKIALRRHALTWAPERPAVLDLFAGEGHMYREAWKPAVGSTSASRSAFAVPPATRPESAGAATTRNS